MNERPAGGPNPKRKLFFGLFIFPLLIAAGMALLLCTVVFLTHEGETPESLITAIKTGSPSKRWQKAFELSNELNRHPEMIRQTGVMKEIIHILGDPERYDPKTRSYMAMALSRFPGPEAVAAVRERLFKEGPEVQLYLIWALGNLNAREAAPDVESFFQNESPDLRRMAVYISGILGGPNTVEKLRPLLKDPVSDVSWNAALALARLGDPSGEEILIKMLDRNSLARDFHLPKDEIETVMVNAVRGLARIETPGTLAAFRKLTEEDENLKVRQVALEALQSSEKEASHG